MGRKGLELVENHPKSLSSEILGEIIYKSMPMGAKPGDFTSTMVGDYHISSFIFDIPQEEDRNNIAAIVAVFTDMKYNMEGIRKFFSVIIKELKNKSLLRVEVVEEILPGLYKGLTKGQINIKVSSIASIKVKIDFDEDQEKIDETKALENDLWR
jgi:hypothetical protein